MPKESAHGAFVSDVIIRLPLDTNKNLNPLSP